MMREIPLNAVSLPSGWTATARVANDGPLGSVVFKNGSEDEVPVGFDMDKGIFLGDTPVPVKASARKKIASAMNGARGERYAAALKKARTKKTSADFTEDDEPPPSSSRQPVGEMQVAEYVIFLLALDTYVRFLEEVTGDETPKEESSRDRVLGKGIRTLRMADAEIDKIKDFLNANLPSATHKRMLEKHLRLRVKDSEGVGRRAWGFEPY